MTFLYLIFTSTTHFSLMVVAAMVFFSVGLLYMDAVRTETKRTHLVLLRSLGFFFLAMVYGFYATRITTDYLVMISQILKIIGLGLILVDLTMEPIIHPPKKTMILWLLPIGITDFTAFLAPFSAVLLLLIALFYLRKSTEGFDRQLKPVALAFFFLTAAEILKITFVWAETNNVYWSKMLAELGPVWVGVDLLTLVGVVILGLWTWSYIRFRLQVQMFVITIMISVATFLVVTFLFVSLLLNNLKNNAIQYLETDLSVVNYSLERLKSEMSAKVLTVAKDNKVNEAFFKNDKMVLYKSVQDFITQQKTDSLVVAKETGEVMARAENTGLANDNVMSDPLFQAVIKGKTEVTAFKYSNSGTGKVMSIGAAERLSLDDSKEILGVILSEVDINNAFVDGLKSATGMDISVYANNERVATTLIAADEKSRFTGTLVTDKNVLSKVLKNGQNYSGPTLILNHPYYAAYTPIRSYEGEIIGMIGVGQPQYVLMDAARKSIDLTFLGSTILIVLSIIPSYFIAKYINRQMNA